MKIATASELQAGRLAMKAKCMQAALEETPERVRLIRIRRSISGSASVREGILTVPRPFTRRALHVFFHECAHIVLDHVSRKPRHVEEMEAEQWATDAMRRHGFAVPRERLRHAKWHVGDQIKRAIRNRARSIDLKAAKFAGVKIKNPPEPKFEL